MNKDNTIKQCVLIGEPINSDYQSSSVFNKVGGVSTIDLCINWLSDNGIKEIFLFYSNSKMEIEEYYKNQQKSDVKILLNYMKPEDMKDFGDVMRQVQFRNIVSQDFLVVFADMVCNLDLQKAIATHFKKKIQLKSVVLTTVLRDNSYDRKIHVTSLQSGQILQMDDDKGTIFNLNSQRIKLKKMNVQFRRDIAHCDIYICTVDVVKSFKQNYQYTTMFDFINGMLTSDVYEQKILGHILQNYQHCYRTNKTKYYYLAYQHFIADHFYPYTLPKIKSATTKEPFKFVTKNFNKVIFSGVCIPISAYISNSCYIGEKNIIGNNVEIQKSILTQNCKISNNVILKNCLILDGCTLAQKAIFQNCLIQKVNETQQIRRFNLSSKFQADIVTQPLHEETPPPEESTFEQDLANVLKAQARMQTINQLNSIRKTYNKSLSEFTTQVLKILNPTKVSQVQEFATNWGPIIMQIHGNQTLFLDSLYNACLAIPEYKGFHVILQYFYKNDHVKGFAILPWYDEALVKYPNSAALSRCQNFISMLRQQQQSDEQASQSLSSSVSQNSD